jgi:CheY-like chemotaxis protein
MVLVADDTPDARDLYCFYLNHTGYRAVTAASGEEAILQALSLRPDVIVIDLMMPGIGGVEAIRRLKIDDITKATPVIAMTANDAEAMRASAFEARCDRFLRKPCVPADLVETIRELLGP